ncbi:MAG TPA: aminoglycoside phosphotransferase family protein [Sphingorhabdus lacus]|nr:aminoglycoside phosphotransferase family protein [Sphingorhabdus lacus]
MSASLADYPTHPDAMQPGWLAETLGFSASMLRGFSVKPVGTGQMCDSYRLTLDWATGAEGAPATVIAKCPSHDPASREVARTLGGYLLEVRWYQTLAHDVAVPRPHCHFAKIEDDGVSFLLLLGDLAPAAQGDQLRGARPAEIDLAVDAAAELHAPLWNSPRLAEIEWLQRDTRPIVRALFPVYFAQFRERYAQRLDPECLALGDGLVQKLDAYLAHEPSATTLQHGDLRVDNILFAPDHSACWVVDWQTLAIGAGARDLAYLVGTSIADPEERAALDRPAFDRWTNRLAALGVATDIEALWQDYRLGALSGYFMAVFASMSVERTERGDEMFAVMAERPARQAIALRSLDIL